MSTGVTHHHTVPWERVPAHLEPLDEQDMEAAVLQREALARLHVLLEALDPDTRDLLALRFAGRLSADDIGAVMGLSAAAVRKWLARATEIEGALP